MRRILPLVATVTLVAASPGLQALGVAELQVQSRLDEPLRARIPLIDLEGVDTDRLQVQLADQAGFDEAGLPRSALIDEMRLSVTHDGDDAALLLSTERAVTEPYLELLLTFEWPSGEQRRQVNLLLDPPEYTRGPALRSASQNATPLFQDAVASTTTDELPDPDPVVVAGTDEARQIVVKTGNTLWSLAEDVSREAGVSVEQAMLSLYNTNPGAFETPNINALRAGAVMNIPASSAMTALGTAQARRQVHEQHQAWQAMHLPSTDTEAGADPQAAPEAPETPFVDASGALALRDAIEDDRVIRVVDASGAEALHEADERPPEQSIAGTGASTAVDERNEASREDGTLKVAEFDAINARQEERLTTLEAKWQTVTEALERVQERDEKLSGMMASLSQNVERLRNQLIATLPPQGQEGGEAGGVFNLAGILQTVKAHAATIGGASALLLLVPLAVLRRRQRVSAGKKNGKNREPDIQDLHQGGTPLGQHADETPRSAAFSMPMNATRPDLQAPAQQTETLNDADVFIAYGRHTAARELLEQELKSAPERHDLRLKLLSVYLELDDHEAAERTASLLRKTAQPSCHQEIERLMARFEKPRGETSRENTACKDSASEGQALEKKAAEDKASKESDFVDEAFAAAFADQAFDEAVAERSSDTQAGKTDGAEPKTVMASAPGHEPGPSLEAENMIDYQPPSLESRSTDSESGMKLPDFPGREDREASVTPAESASVKQELRREPGTTSDKEWDIQEVAFDPPRWDEASATSDTPRR